MTITKDTQRFSNICQAGVWLLKLSEGGVDAASLDPLKTPLRFFAFGEKNV